MAINPAPHGMRQSAWDYLLSFTEKHEALVLCLYNASKSTADITIGIGTSIPDEKFIRANAWVKDMFQDKDDPTKAIAVEDVVADYNNALKIQRVGNVDPNTHLIQEYAGLQLRTTRDKAVARMAAQFATNLNNMLKGAWGHWFDEFPAFPADAQVGCVSFSYGRPAWDYPLLKRKHSPNPFWPRSERCNYWTYGEAERVRRMLLLKQAIGNWNFIAASDQVWIKGAAFLKNVAHQTLFWNGGCVVEQQKDFDRIWSQPQENPARLPWKPWSEEGVDSTSRTSTPTTTAHTVPEAKPKFKEPPPPWLRGQFSGDFKE